MNRRKAEVGLFINVVVWGATFVLVKTALRDISPLLFLALRFGLATVAMLFLLRRSRRQRTTPRTLAAAALAGVFLMAGFLFQTLGLRLTTPPKSAFITGLTSIVVPLLSALVYKIRPQISEVIGVLVATAGLGLMSLEPGSATIGRGDLLTVLGAFAFAAHIVTVGHFSGQMSFEVLSVAQVASAAVLAFALFGWAESPHVVWRPAVIAAIVITGLFCTAMAFAIQSWAMQYTTSTRTALIFMLEPVVAWITSFFLTGEGLAGRAALGAALILLGVLVVEMKPLQSRQHP